jgi:hypothetical protein
MRQEVSKSVGNIIVAVNRVKSVLQIVITSVRVYSLRLLLSLVCTVLPFKGNGNQNTQLSTLQTPTSPQTSGISSQQRATPTHLNRRELFRFRSRTTIPSPRHNSLCAYLAARPTCVSTPPNRWRGHHAAWTSSRKHSQKHSRKPRHGFFACSKTSLH